MKLIENLRECYDLSINIFLNFHLILFINSLCLNHIHKLRSIQSLIMIRSCKNISHMSHYKAIIPCMFDVIFLFFFACFRFIYIVFMVSYASMVDLYTHIKFFSFRSLKTFYTSRTCFTLFIKKIFISILLMVLNTIQRILSTTFDKQNAIATIPVAPNK